VRKKFAANKFRSVASANLTAAGYTPKLLTS